MTEQTPIKDAADATNRVTEFLRQHYSFVFPVQAKKEGGWWFVDVDVGAARTIIVRAKVDAFTGGVVEYGRLREG